MISIIIVSYNVKDYLEKCIQSIIKFSIKISYEIIIVDNNSMDGSNHMLKKYHSNKIKLIFNRENLGFSKAVNIGLKYSKGDFLLLVNPDTVFIENIAKRLKDFIEQNPKVGIVGCKVLNKDKTFQISSRRNFPYLYSLMFKLIGLSKWFPENKFISSYNMTYINENIISKNISISGACMMFRKKMIKKIGLFDERFFLYFEDTDFCFRAIKAGYNVVYYPETQIIHHKGASSKKNISYAKNHFDQSFLKFFKKYKHKYFFNFITLHILIAIILIRKNIRILFKN
ncbi:MAG: glycosyl transferase family 2 [Candidatus Marinimicrobia bacterium]|nr:glycosyl transferase family 2 [Candidatus Neomarinimicrobiota bacterium]|tara:strand:- start:2135 stop:2989 length:855 start_codon:yes stop_codon:yes gene_type:complete